MNWLSENWVNILAIATSIVTAASVAVKLTPTTSDDKVVDGLLKFIQWLSINGAPKK